MVMAGDLIRLVYTPDLTAAGIAYACQRLPHLSGNDLEATYKELRQLILDKAVELAFRRYLVEQGVESKTVAAATFGRQDPFHLLLGGWHCVFQSCWIDAPDTIQQVHSQPECLLQAAALLPSERVIAWVPGERDLYIFAFITGGASGYWREPDQAIAAKRPVQWLTLLPGTWAKPKSRELLGRLEFSNETSEPLRLDIGGRTITLNLVSEQLGLLPGERILSQHSYDALEYLHTSQLPTGRVGIYSPTQRRKLHIPPSAWRNVWLNGIAIYLGGYISHPEYARRSRRLPSGSRIFPATQGHDKTRVLSVSELHSLRELLESAKSGS